MTRGAPVIVATRGVYASKPRLALIVHADSFNDTHASITIARRRPTSSTLPWRSMARVPPSRSRSVVRRHRSEFERAEIGRASARWPYWCRAGSRSSRPVLRPADRHQHEHIHPHGRTSSSFPTILERHFAARCFKISSICGRATGSRSMFWRSHPVKSPSIASVQRPSIWPAV